MTDPVSQGGNPSVEDRLRDVESHTAVSLDRWKGQYADNERWENKLTELERCVNRIEVTLKVNNRNMALIFVGVQIVVGALAMAVAAKVF